MQSNLAHAAQHLLRAASDLVVAAHHPDHTERAIHCDTARSWIRQALRDFSLDMTTADSPSYGAQPGDPAFQTIGAAASAVVTNLADHRAARDQSIGMTAADIGE